MLLRVVCTSHHKGYVIWEFWMPRGLVREAWTVLPTGSGKPTAGLRMQLWLMYSKSGARWCTVVARNAGWWRQPSLSTGNSATPSTTLPWQSPSCLSRACLQTLLAKQVKTALHAGLQAKKKKKHTIHTIALSSISSLLQTIIRKENSHLVKDRISK